MHPPFNATLNASLNGLAGIFLVCGFIAIKKKRADVHQRFMFSAVVCSALFLCSYLYYHLTTRGISHYQGKGMIKAAYLIILATHSLLAALIVPFVIMAVYWGLRGEFQKHTQITRKLFPAWAYVSVTGVLVYLMLYIFPAG